MDGSGWTIPQNMPKGEDETPGPSSDTYDPMIVGQQERYGVPIKQPKVLIPKLTSKYHTL